MMNEAPFAYTSKLFDNMYTVRGNDIEEFKTNLAHATTAIAAIAKLQAAIKGESAAAVTSQPLAAPQPVARPVEDPFASEPVVNGHICAHGIRVWREGTSKAGKAYAGWYCTSRDQSSQCPPEYPPRGR